MGCDIHAAIEWMRSDGGGDGVVEWRSFTGVLDIRRDYELFGFMAGVRRPEHEHLEPRGEPVGMSYEARNMLDGCHSVSWLTADELASVARKYQEQEYSSADTRTTLEAIVMMMRVFDPDARLVFGFDN